MNLVVIDDEPIIANGLAGMVRKLDGPYTVKGVFSDPEEALELCDWDDIQLALVDISMPELDGLSLNAAVRERGFTTQIVYITAHANFEYAQRAVHLGALDYLLKPVSRRSLEPVLAKAEENHLRDLARRQDERYIRQNLFRLRKAFFNDLIFEEQRFRPEQAARRSGQYFLTGCAYSLILFFSRWDRGRLKEYLRGRVEEESWFLYGQEYFFVLLLIQTDPGELERAMSTGGAMERWVSEGNIRTPDSLSDAYQRLLTQLRGLGAGLLPEMEAGGPELPSEREMPVPVRQAVRYIRTHYRDRLSLKTIADEIYLHPTYFSNLFKKQTGFSVVDYINYVRIIKAKEMLREPQNKIYWVMEQVGFVNQRYFSQVFKKQTGMTPTQYKQESFLGR